MPRGGEEIAAAHLLELAPAGWASAPRGEDIELSVYLEQDDLERVREAFPQAELEPVPGDWEGAWREFHRPVTVGSLWIGPPWEEPPGGLTAVVIDPGRAFGTGAHETTRLCLELLLEADRGSLLDAGCGSGVLAVAAAKLGFRPVVALDAEDAALEAARRNAERNGVRIELRQADLLAAPLPRAELVVANIDLRRVELLAARLDCRRVVTSGYLCSDEPRLEGFRHLERRSLGDWAADLYERE